MTKGKWQKIYLSKNGQELYERLIPWFLGSNFLTQKIKNFFNILKLVNSLVRFSFIKKET